MYIKIYIYILFLTFFLKKQKIYLSSLHTHLLSPVKFISYFIKTNLSYEAIITNLCDATVGSK